MDQCLTSNNLEQANRETVYSHTNTILHTYIRISSNKQVWDHDTSAHTHTHIGGRFMVGQCPGDSVTD